MASSIIGPIEKADSADWGSRTIRLQHRLHENPLFSDESLAALIERTPQSVSPIVLMPGRDNPQGSWGYCDRSGLSGEAVLEAIKRGRLWINMLKLEEVDSRFSDLLDTIFEEFGNAIPGFAPFRKTIGVLISSPGTRVSYHADVPGQSLWQIRGKKRIYLYPPHEPFLKAANLENIIRGVTEEEIPYDATYDEYAEIYDLEPGDMMHWVLNGPHRVENADCLNISVTTEHWTPTTRRNFAMNYGNGVLRREFGWTPKSHKITGPAFWAKVGVTAAWRAMGLQQKTAFQRVISNRVDPNAPHGVVPLTTSSAE